MYFVIFLCFAISIVSSTTTTAPPDATTQQQYVVPEATIDLLQPKGFSVSLPMSDGETLFAFHGNINKPIENLEAGQFSRDILRPKNGRWTFVDETTNLKSGDTINYWTYVIRNGLGYRRDNQQYVVPKYVVPMANIDVHASKGFSVSIPNSPGVTLFAFHGNVNKPLNNLEAGQYSMDINVAENDQWTFSDINTELKTGDVINYWTYVIKDGLGYRNDAQQYVVQDADLMQSDRVTRSTIEPIESTTALNDHNNNNCSDTKMTVIHQHYHHFDSPPKNLLEMMGMPLSAQNAPAPISTTTPPPSSTHITTTVPCENNEKIIRLRNQLRDTIEKYQDFYDRTQNLEIKVESLNEVISDLIGDKNIGTKLVLRSDEIPIDSTMIDAVRSVIDEKLRLPDLSKTIVVARKSRDNNGIVFETNSSIDKLRILARANDRLKYSKIRIYDI